MHNYFCYTSYAKTVFRDISLSTYALHTIFCTVMILNNLSKCPQMYPLKKTKSIPLVTQKQRDTDTKITISLRVVQ